MKIFSWACLITALTFNLAGDTITTVNGSQSGSLKEWSEGETLSILDSEGQLVKTLPKEEFVTWQSRAVRAQNEGRIFVRLTNGVGLQALVEEWTEEGVKLRNPLFGKDEKTMVRKFAYDEIRMVIFLDRVPGTKKEQLLQKIRATTIKEDDFLFLKNDHLSGLLISVDRNVLQFDRDDETKNFKMTDVVAFVLANEMKPSEHELLLRTDEGFEFPIKSFKEVDGKLAIDSPIGQLQISKKRLSSVSYFPKNRLFLGDLTPSKTEEGFPNETFPNYPYTYKINRSNVEEQPLSTKSRKWSRGIGVHSDSKLTWNLPKNAKSLAGAVAIDNEAKGQGSVYFTIYVDDKKLFESGLMTGDLPAKFFKIDLTGKKTIRLEVLTDPGKKQKDVTQDRADWLDLILTLKK